MLEQMAVRTNERGGEIERNLAECARLRHTMEKERGRLRDLVTRLESRTKQVWTIVQQIFIS